MEKKLGIIALIAGVVVAAAVAGFYVSNEGSQGSRVTLDITAFNLFPDDDTRTIRVTISIDGKDVLDNNVTRPQRLTIPWGVRDCRLEVEEGKHTVKARVTSPPLASGAGLKAEVEREIEIDDNSFIWVEYADSELHITKHGHPPYLL